MKSMKLYLLLIVAVLILIAASAALTQKFIALSAAGTKKLQTVNIHENGSTPDISATSETTIQLDQATPAPDTKNKEWRRKREADGEPEFAAPPPGNKPGIGTVASVSGSAFIINNEDKSIPLSKDSRVMMNSKINTGPNSSLKIAFDDGSVISQGENSSVVIDEFLYSPDSPNDNFFSMKVIKGVCRTVTGMITNLNPERYKVKTRMATIGIRGCDLIFLSSPLMDDIYVLALGGEKIVMIDTTKNGSPMHDMSNNTEMTIDESIKTSIPIDESGQMVRLIRGKKPNQRSVSVAETRNMIDQTSKMSPAKYEMIHDKDGMIFEIQPTQKGNL